MSWLTALKVTVVAGALGAGLLATGVIIDAHLHIPERATTAQVLSVTACYREECGYSLSYTDARGMPELAEIPGPQGEVRGLALTVRIYYQDAHPGTARFPDTVYQGSEDDLNTLIGIAVITILFALFMLLVTLVKVAMFLRRRRSQHGPQHAPQHGPQHGPTPPALHAVRDTTRRTARRTARRTRRHH